MNIPKGATRYNTFNQYYYKGERPKLQVFIDDEWCFSALEECNDKYFLPIQDGEKQVRSNKIDQREQTRQAIIDLAAKQCGLSGDSIRQLATVLAAEGYRKFEIVEEEV